MKVVITQEQARMVRAMLEAITVQGVEAARKVAALDDTLARQLEADAPDQRDKTGK